MVQSGYRLSNVRRVLMAISTGLCAALIAASYQILQHKGGGDFNVILRAARIVLGAANPYDLIHPMTGDGGHELLATFFLYPLPTFAFGVPFLWLSPAWAAVCFSGCSAGLLCYAITKDGYQRFPIFLSVPFLVACRLGQMSVIATALSLIPVAAGLSAIAKPNIALALFARAPRWRTVVTGGAVLLGSWLLVPSWPFDWLATIHRQPIYHAPGFRIGGVFALLAALRWRRPEARLLLAMAVIPHALYWYDELPLFMVAETHREVMTLVWCSWLAYAGWFVASHGVYDWRNVAAWVVPFMYIPVTIMVLRRPNVAA